MSSDRLITHESQAINLILDADENTLLILDFDEALWLRNSTAEYLNSLRPRLLGFILRAAIKIVRPWIWLPKPFRGDNVRDWFLIFIPTVLLPWTFFLWRRKVQSLAKNYQNLELLAAVDQNKRSPVIIASLGFGFIINPILQQLFSECLANQNNQSYSLVSCRFWQGAKDRNQGKLSMMREILLDSTIKSAILITDSEDDLPLLKVVQHPCLVTWSLAKYVRPFDDFWLSSALDRLKK